MENIFIEWRLLPRKKSNILYFRYVVALDDKKQMKILCGTSGIELWNEDTEDNIQFNIIQIQQCSLDNFSLQLLLLLNKEDEFSFYILNIPSKKITLMLSCLTFRYLFNLICLMLNLLNKKRKLRFHINLLNAFLSQFLLQVINIKIQ